MASTPAKLIKSYFADVKLSATQWEDAEAKRAFLVNLARFVDSGFDPKLFTKKLYRRLSMCFSHIAHYNQGGFYAEWFEDDSRRAKWIQYIINRSIYGDPAWTYSDAERVFQTWLKKWIETQDRTLPWPSKVKRPSTPVVKAGNFQAVGDTILGPKEYMTGRGDELMNLVIANDPETLQKVADHLDGTLDADAALCRFLAADFQSWVASRN